VRGTQARRAALVIALGAVALGTLGACGKKKRQTRSSDAPPVELVSVAGLSDAGVGGKAAESDEREPNDGADVATALAVGGAVRGRIEPDNEADYYRIEVEQAGALTVSLAAVAGLDLSLEIEDAAGAPLARSDRGAANVAEGVPNLGVTPGRYIAVVRKKALPAKKVAPKPARPKKGAPGAPASPEPATPGTAPAYRISAQVAPPGKNAEREPDDDRGTANDLIVGDTVTGFVGWGGDSDVWKFSVEALTDKNVLELELGAVEGLALAVEIADGIGQTIVSRKAPKGAPLVIRGLAPVVPQGAPPFHYVVVKSDRASSNPEVAYQLKLAAHPRGTDPELEPNDTPDKAMEIPGERTVISDASWTPGDADCYAVPPEPNERALDFNVDTPAEADLRVELYVNGKSIETADKKGKGTPEKISGAVPAGARAVLCLRGSDASREGKYSLGFKEGQPKP
jgi:hypothetical protein